MPKVKVLCDFCGKEFLKYLSSVGDKKFCSKECVYKFKSKKYNPEGYCKHEHLTELNIKLNPTRMTDEVKENIRWSHTGMFYPNRISGKPMTDETKENIRWGHLLKGVGKAYPKIYGRHAHRVVAEAMIGRKLRPGEVVHHKDENRLNYSEDNLEVLASQKEHAKLHFKNGRFK